MKALIVDDELPARDRLAALLRECGNVEIVGDAANGRDAVEAVARLNPDLVLLDIRNPRPPPGARRGGGNGVALANTRSRIEYHFERGGGLDTEAGVDYFICSVRLPCPGATARPKPAGAQKELIAEAETVHESPDR